MFVPNLSGQNLPNPPLPFVSRSWSPGGDWCGFPDGLPRARCGPSGCETMGTHGCWTRTNKDPVKSTGGVWQKNLDLFGLDDSMVKISQTFGFPRVLDGWLKFEHIFKAEVMMQHACQVSFGQDMAGASLLRFCRLIRLVRVVTLRGRAKQGVLLMCHGQFPKGTRGLSAGFNQHIFRFLF